MPDIQIIQPGFSFSSQLGAQLGSGLSEGLSAGLNNFFQRKHQTASAKALGQLAGLNEAETKELSALPPDMQKFAIQHRQATRKAAESGKQFISKNLKREMEAAGLYTGDYGKIQKDVYALIDQGVSPTEAANQVISQSLNETNAPAATDKSTFEKELGMKPPQAKDLGGALAVIGRAATAGAQFPLDALNAIGSAGRRLINKAAGLSPEEIAQKEKKFQSDIAAGEQATGVINPIAGTSLVEGYDRITGNAGVPQNDIEEVLGSAVAFGKGGLVGSGLEVAGRNLGASEPVQKALNIIGFLGAHNIKGMKKTPAQKGAGKVIENAESVAKKTGSTAEEVLSNAQEKSGADLGKVSEGNAAEINKLNKAIKLEGRATSEAPKVAEKVKAAPKTVFNKQAAIREREAFGAKLPEQPLAEYLAPEEVSNPKPETIAKQKEITARLEPEVTRLHNEITDATDHLRRLNSDIKRVSPTELPRVEALRKRQEAKIEKLREDLRDVNYELKYFRKRPTEAEINAQIKKSSEEFLSEAKKSTEAGQKKINRQLELDKDYIDAAEKALARGELPGEVRPDTHIRMKKKYADGYREIIKQQKEAMQKLGKTKADVIEKQALKKHIEHLEDRLKRLDADIVNQSEKIKVKRALEKPSGAFYKQQLKSLRKDIDDFKKDYFTNRLPTSAKGSTAEAKTNIVGPAEIKKINEKVKEFKENPTPENLKKAADEAGLPKEPVNEVIKEAEQKAKEVKSGDASKKEAVETVTKSWNNKVGKTIKSRLLRRIFTPERIVGLLLTAITSGTASTAYGTYKYFSDEGSVNQYAKALKDKDNKKIQELEKGFVRDRYAKTRIKAIRESAAAKNR